MANAAVVEYGAGTVVADWKDIKGLYGASTASIQGFCNGADLSSTGKAAWILLFGQNYNSGSRHYFVERHDGILPANFTVAASMGAHILDLGTSITVSKPILVKLGAGTPVIRATPLPSAGGKVTGGGPYRSGHLATVVATAAPGYHFVKWTQNGAVVSVNATYSFTATTSRTLKANFATP